MRRKTTYVVVLSSFALMATSGVSVTQLDASAVASAQSRTASAAPCAGTGTAPAVWEHVVLVMFENKPLKKIIGNTTDAPYINSVAKACSYSRNTLSLSPTSLANYIALTSGSTGCETATAAGACTRQLPITANDDPTVWPQPQRSLFELMNATSAGSAKEWGEDRPSNCALKSARSSNYTVTHTPFPYYTRTRDTLCRQYAVAFPATPSQTLSARFNLVIPNKKNIMHLVPGTTIAQRIRNGDTWLKGFLPALLDSPEYQAGRTAILITWDEGNARSFLVPLIAITPYTEAGGVSSVAYDHYSTLKGIQEMLAVSPLLGHAADAGKNSVRDDTAFRLKP